MDITVTFQPKSRAEWRNWLEQHHKSSTEIWLLSKTRDFLDTQIPKYCIDCIYGLVLELPLAGSQFLAGGYLEWQTNQKLEHLCHYADALILEKLLS